jgi:hypothetical protein
VADSVKVRFSCGLRVMAVAIQIPAIAMAIQIQYLH